MNYIMRGIQALKESFLAGILVYLAILALLYLFKKRRNISWKCIFEAIFCVYCVTLLNLTGIFTLRYSLNGSFSYFAELRPVLPAWFFVAGYFSFMQKQLEKGGGHLRPDLVGN